MHSNRFLLLLALGALAAPGAARAEDALADTAFLQQYAATYRFRLGRPGSITVAPDGGEVLFLRSGPRRFVQDLYVHDVASGAERPLLTAEQVLKGAEERLTPAERARRERLRSAARGIASFELSRDGRRILVPLSGRLFVIERGSGAATELQSEAGPPEDPRFSPDGGQVACVREGDLYVTDVATGAERRLTRRETAQITNGLAEFVAQEEMNRFEGYWWSPDSRWIAYERADASGVERFHIVDPANPWESPQSWPYPRPGRKNVDVKLGVMPAAGGPTVWVRWDRTRYPYLAAVCWEKNAPLTLLVQNREQTQEALLAADPVSGATRALLVERDAAWLNLERGVPRWLADGSGFLWITERNGAPQLELRGRDGRLRRALTPVTLVVDELLHVDQDRGVVWVKGGAEPTETHLYRVPLAGGRPERVSREAGVHDAAFAREGGTWVHGVETLAGERRWVVRHADGVVAGELRSVAERPPWAPRVELTTVGPRHFRAALVRPHDFDPRRRYPVMVYVYAGPHTLQVRATAFNYLMPQWIADQGMVVVMLDGRGTPGRGRAWERVLKGNFIRVPLADQVAGLEALGARYPELDLGRVGIFGWSFGGYFTAMALMQRPEVFTAGVAGAPVVDWRDYDAHYTERYLGLPDRDAAGYQASSVLTYAARLERPLLLIHGTADDNVYPVHSMKLCQALENADKEFEFVPLVGKTHGVSDPAATFALYARIARFFRLHLGQPASR